MPRSKPTPPERVKLQIIYPAGYYIASVKSGNRYVWDGPGAITSVNECDAEELLSRTRVVGCCGRPVEELPLFRRISE